LVRFALFTAMGMTTGNMKSPADSPKFLESLSNPTNHNALDGSAKLHQGHQYY